MIAAPVKEALLKRYAEAPQFLGGLHDVHVITEHGRRLVDVGGQLKEVVVATAADVAAASGNLVEGVYLAGSGNTGAAATFFTLGAVYTAVISAGALSYRVPAEGWVPAGFTPPPSGEDPKYARTMPASGNNAMITTANVHIDTALKTPQFWGLWTCLCMNVTAGIGVLGVAKLMMTVYLVPSRCLGRSG